LEASGASRRLFFAVVSDAAPVFENSTANVLRYVETWTRSREQESTSSPKHPLEDVEAAFEHELKVKGLPAA
jgi:hypothetical protein